MTFTGLVLRHDLAAVLTRPGHDHAFRRLDLASGGERHLAEQRRVCSWDVHWRLHVVRAPRLYRLTQTRKIFHKNARSHVALLWSGPADRLRAYWNSSGEAAFANASSLAALAPKRRKYFNATNKSFGHGATM